MVTNSKPPSHPNTSGFLGFLFGPVAAALVARANFKRLGQQRKANLTLGFTVLVCFVLLLVLFQLPDKSARNLGVAMQVTTAILFPAIQKRDFKKWQSNNPGVKPDGSWKLLIWCILGVLALFLIAGVAGVIAAILPGGG